MKKGILILCCLAFLLAGGCSRDRAQTIKVEKPEDGFQSHLMYAVQIDTGDGFYYVDYRGFLFYFDYGAKKESIVCNKSNCKHEAWSEGMPREERCHAEVGGRSTGFVYEKKLYIMENGFDTTGFQQIRIVESDLDRTNQREVKVLDCDSIYSFAVKDGVLYIVADQAEMIEKEDGSKEGGANRVLSLCAIDLSDGEMRTLAEMKGLNSALRIMDAEDDSMYFDYSYFEKEFDGTNFQEAKQHTEYYEYSLENGALEKILTGIKESDIISASLVNGNFFAWTVPSSRTMEEGETIVSELKKISPETGAEELLAQTTDDIIICGNYAVYTKEGVEGGFVYDFLQEKELAAPKMELKNFSLICPAGEYLYGVWHDEETQESVYCFILLKDLMEGKESYILVHT